MPSLPYETTYCLIASPHLAALYKRSKNTVGESYRHPFHSTLADPTLLLLLYFNLLMFSTILKLLQLPTFLWTRSHPHFGVEDMSCVRKQLTNLGIPDSPGTQLKIMSQ